MRTNWTDRFGNWIDRFGVAIIGVIILCNIAWVAFIVWAIYSLVTWVTAQ